ncbi:MAG: hypothetical protein U0Q03_06475 [Acidimicrobiales bacterium]
MRLRSVGIVLLVSGVLVATGCGDPSTADRDAGAEAASDTTTPATEAASVSTTAEAPAPTVAMPDTLVPPPTTVTAAGDELDWVFASDPFPAQADAATDPEVATEAVVWAYRHWILLDLDPALRARILENGEANSDRIEDTLRAVEGTIDGAGFEVDQVDLTGVDSAQVVFRITWQGGPSPIFPDPITGSAVYADGSWRVGGRTLCLLAIGIGQECRADQRLAPDAYRVTGLPPGAVRSTDFDTSGRPIDVAEPDVVPIPGIASWTAADGPAFGGESGPDVWISTQWLPDVASLTEADLAVVVRARWGSGDGSTGAVADGRGRTESQDGYARVLVVRPDDVVVYVTSATLTVDELISLVDGLEPVDLR